MTGSETEIDKEKVREGYIELIKRHIASALRASNGSGAKALSKVEDRMRHMEL
jgi:hypothetical protein